MSNSIDYSIDTLQRQIEEMRIAWKNAEKQEKEARSVKEKIYHFWHFLYVNKIKTISEIAQLYGPTRQWVDYKVSIIAKGGDRS